MLFVKPSIENKHGFQKKMTFLKSTVSFKVWSSLITQAVCFFGWGCGKGEWDLTHQINSYNSKILECTTF